MSDDHTIQMPQSSGQPKLLDFGDMLKEFDDQVVCHVVI